MISIEHLASKTKDSFNRAYQKVKNSNYTTGLVKTACGFTGGLILYTATGAGISSATQENYHPNLNLKAKSEFSKKSYDQIGNKISKTISMQQAQGKGSKDPEEDNKDENLVKDSKNTTPNSNYFSTPDSTYDYVEKNTDNAEQINKLESKYATEVKSIGNKVKKINNLDNGKKVKNSKKPITYASEVDNAKYEGVIVPLKERSIVGVPDAVVSFYGDQYLNVFIQPNLKNQGNLTFEYYGSGNISATINNDTVINWYDYSLISTTDCDERDINGSGVYTNTGTETVLGVIYPNDKQMLKNYLTDQPGYRYLPAHWDWTQTPTERISWYKKTVVIDHPQTPPLPWCGDYTSRHQVHESGVEEIGTSGLSDTTYNMRFNLPVNQDATITSANDAHWINSIATGDTLTSPNTHYRMEPQTGQEALIGGPSIHEDSHLNTKRFVYYWNSTFNQYMHSMRPIVDMDLTNGVVTNVTVMHPDAVLYRTLKNVEIQGDIPIDIYVEWANSQLDTTPNNTGWPTNVSPAGIQKIRSDSVVVTGPVSGFDYRDWELKQDQVIDTTLGSRRQIFWNNGRPPQIIEWGDNTAPEIIANQTQDSILYSSYISGGLLKPTVTDNSGLWDSTYVVTTTQGTDPALCSFYEFLATATTNAWDSASPPNTSSLIEQVQVYLDDPQWTYFPEDDSLDFRIPTTIAGTGGPATATSPSGPAGVVGVINTYINTDTMTCENVNYIDEIVYTATDSACGKTITGTQTIYKFKPMALLSTNSPPDTIYIGKDDPKDPPSVWEPTYIDTIKPWYPTSYTYIDELISASPTDSVWLRKFTGQEEICYTTLAGPNHFLVKDLEVGINEGGLENKLRKDYVKVFPNPTTGKLNLEYDVSKIEKINTEIYDVTGKLIDYFQEQIFPGENKTEIDLSDLPNGMYIIQTSIGNEILETDKVFINHRLSRH